ncbi:MAG: ABC transporter permease, partial [Candidatus Pacearchaeota archaeon]|nr:ABC transporter permease [Candidatus Pacearchaeota archaeon]
MLKDYFLMALDNIKHRGIRSWLTMIGIFIGIAAVVSLISLGQGLQEAITGQFRSLSTDTLIVQSSAVASYLGPPGTTAVRKLNERDLNLISSISGVDIAIPRLIRSVKVEYNDVVGFKYLASLPQNQEQIDYLYKIADLKVAEGRLLKPNDKRKIIIGADFINKEQFGKEIKLSSNLKIQGVSFEVIGILQKSGSIQINNAALLIEDDLKEILNISDEIDLIAIKVVSKERVEETAELIKKKLRKDRNQKEGEEDFSVQTPIKAIESVTTILNILNLVVIGIAIVSLFVGGVGIANTMYTSVLERYKEIGVMKAVGA